jgi:hypothetical protein
MKKARGKSNLSIVQDYVSGNRPFTQISMTGTDDLSNRKEGEEWESGGKKWRKFKGNKVQISNIKSKILDRIRDMHICSICKCDTRFSLDTTKEYDLLVIYKTKKCYECFIEFETLLKHKGFYANYVKNRDFRNLKAKLLDFKAKLVETIEWCNSPNSRKIHSINDTGVNSVELETEHDTTDRVDIIKKDATTDLQLVDDRLSDIDKELLTLTSNIDDVNSVEQLLKEKYKDGRDTPNFIIETVGK